MYSDMALQLAIQLEKIPAETKIITMQIILIVAEIVAFFYIRHITKN